MKLILTICSLLMLQGCMMMTTNVERDLTPEEEAEVLAAMSRLCVALPESCGRFQLDDFKAITGEEWESRAGNRLLGRYNHTNKVFAIFVDHIAAIDRRIQDVAIHEMLHALGMKVHNPNGWLTHSGLDPDENQLTRSDLEFVCLTSKLKCLNIQPEVDL